MMDLLTKEKTLKGVVFGNGGVGKTTFCRKCSLQDTNGIISTIGVDFVRVELGICFNSIAENVTMIIWDTAGQERFRTITTTYARGTHIFFFICDLTQPETIIALSRWADDAFNSNQVSSVSRSTHIRSLYHIIGNKMDSRTPEELVGDRKMLDTIANELSIKFKKSIRFSMCSAKTNSADILRKIVKGLIVEYFIDNPNELDWYTKKATYLNDNGGVNFNQKPLSKPCCH
jgi:GTPase SAR1 family protein